MSDLEFDAKEMGEGRPTVQLVKCESRGLSIVDEDHWCDELPEEGELPDDIAVALDQLNKVINDSTYKVWWPGKVRIDVDALWKELDDREAEEIDKASEGIQ
jgi:23S rRNA A2030 N6-methylase RlmJ